MLKEYPGLHRVVADYEPNFGTYQTLLTATVTRFGLENTAFASQDQPRTIQTALRLLNGLQIEPDFLEKPEKALYLLAIADTWVYLDQISSFRSFEEKAGLVNLVKSLACDTHKSYSQTVRRASAAGRVLVGKIFDPANKPTPHEEENAAFEQLVIDTVKQHTDQEETQRMRQRLASTGPGSLLHDIRTFAGKPGIPIHAVVLNLTTDEMAHSLRGMGAGVGNIDGQKIMVLPKDASDQTIQHEAMHYLLPHIAEDFLMRGLLEAWIEEHTSKPETYNSQRKVLRQITQEDPQLSAALDDAFRDESGNAKLTFLSLVVDRYGLRGLLTLGRMDRGLYNSYRMGLDPRKVGTIIDDIMLEKIFGPGGMYSVPFKTEQSDSA